MNLWGWAKGIQQRFQRWRAAVDLPWWQRYLIFGVLVLICFTGWIMTPLIQERRLVAAIHDTPDDGELYRDLMLLHLDEHPYWHRRGLAILQRLANAWPDHAWPKMRLAESDRLFFPWKRTMSERGAAWADQALHAESADEGALANLALLYLDVGDIKNANRAAQRALEIQPDDREALFMAGWAQKRLGNLQEAKEAFSQCADADVLKEEYARFCHRELIAADREIKIVLGDEQLDVQTQVKMELPSEVVGGLVRRQSPAYAIGRLAWGIGWIESRSGPLANLQEDPQIRLDASMIVASSRAEIAYQDLWMGRYAGEYPSLTLGDLPLAAYTSPTTVTVVSDGARVISSTHPYRTISDQEFSWRLDQMSQPGEPLRMYLKLSPIQQLKLRLSTNSAKHRRTHLLAWTAPTILILFALSRLRHSVAAANRDTPRAPRLWARSVPPWWVDYVLLASGALIVLYPLWLEINGSPSGPPHAYYGYLLTVVMLFTLLGIGPWHKDRHTDTYLTCLGVTLFACYLVARLLVQQLIVPRLILGLIVGRFLLTRHSAWQKKLDWSRLTRLFSPEGEADIERIVSLMGQLTCLESARRSLSAAMAKGKVELSSFLASLRKLAPEIRKNKVLLDLRKQEHGVPVEEPWRQVLLALGPRLSPWKNGLCAVRIGLIPYVTYLILGSLAGSLLETYQGGIGLSSLADLAFDLFTVPWGPLFLGFFGCLFHLLWGRTGVIKALILSIVLISFNTVWSWVWFWDQLDVVALWGLSVRILTTLVFVGAVMDWMTVRRSWRRLHVVYSSPAVTTLITVLGTALTTLVTGLLTGTLDRLLSIALRGLSAAF